MTMEEEHHHQRVHTTGCLSGHGVDGTTSEATAEEKKWEKVVTAAAGASETVTEEKKREDRVHATSAAKTAGSSKAGEKEEVGELVVLAVLFLESCEFRLFVLFALISRFSARSKCSNSGFFSSGTGILLCGIIDSITDLCHLGIGDVIVAEEEERKDRAHVTSTAGSTSKTTAEEEKWEEIVASTESVTEEKEREDGVHATGTTEETWSWSGSWLWHELARCELLGSNA